jgi:hypothetical protein
MITICRERLALACADAKGSDAWRPHAATPGVD